MANCCPSFLQLIKYSFSFFFHSYTLTRMDSTRFISWLKINPNDCKISYDLLFRSMKPVLGMFTVIAIFRDTLVDKHRDKFSSNNIDFPLTAGCRGCVRSQETGWESGSQCDLRRLWVLRLNQRGSQEYPAKWILYSYASILRFKKCEAVFTG